MKIIKRINYQILTGANIMKNIWKRMLRFLLKFSQTILHTLRFQLQDTVLLFGTVLLLDPVHF